MIAFPDFLDRWSESWRTWIIHAGWQSAVVGVLILGVVGLGRRLASPLRYALLVLALAKFAMPPLACLPTGIFSRATVNVDSEAATVHPLGDSMTVAQRLDLATAAEPVSVHPSHDFTESQPVADTSRPGWMFLHLRTWLMLLHGLGILVVVVWIGREHHRMCDMVRAGRPITEGPALQQYHSLCRRMGLRRRPQIVAVSREVSPFLFGVLRPVVVLPEALVNRFSDQDLHAVLAHELAHFRRGDLWINAGQTALCAVWWFHPVIWLVNRALRSVREDCCDDLLLEKQLATGEGLCETLYRVAAIQARPTSSVVTTAMPGGVERLAGRFRRNMDGTLKRSTRLSLGGLLVLVLSAMCLLPGLRTEGVGDDAQGAAAPDPAPVPGAAETDAKQAAPSAPSTRIVRGKVVDKTGQPVAGAEVWLPIKYGWPGQGERRVRNTKTGSQGRFTLEVPGQWLAEERITRMLWVLWAYAPHYSLGTASAFGAILKGDSSDIIVEVGPPADTAFVMLDPDGRPLAGAVVEPLGFVTPVAGEIVPEELMPHFRTRSDAEGRARFAALPREGLYTVRITAKGLGIQEQRVDVQANAPPLRTIRLGPVGRVEGRVLADGNRPEAVRGVRVRLRTVPYPKKSPPPWPIEGTALVETDSQGRFTVPAIATGALQIYAVVDERLGLQPKLPERYAVNVEAGQTTTVDLPMTSTVPVRGSIRVQGTLKPVPKAEIHISYGEGQSANVVSGAEGNFAARVLPGQVRLQVIVLPEQYARLHSQMFPSAVVPDDAKEFELPLIEVAPARIFSGRLIDERGRPVAGARLAIVEGDRYYGGGFSDKDGRFTMHDVPETIEPTKASYQVIALKTEPVARREAKVIQPDPLVLRVKLNTQE